MAEITAETMLKTLNEVFAGDIAQFRAYLLTLKMYAAMRGVEAIVAKTRDEQSRTNQDYEQALQALEQERAALEEQIKAAAGANAGAAAG